MAGSASSLEALLYLLNQDPVTQDSKQSNQVKSSLNRWDQTINFVNNKLDLIVSQEASLLEELALSHSSSYDFVTQNDETSMLFSDIFDALVRIYFLLPASRLHASVCRAMVFSCMQLTSRLMHGKWRSGLKQDHLLRVLQCTRLLSRDKALRQRFVSLGAVEVNQASVFIVK